MLARRTQKPWSMKMITDNSDADDLMNLDEDQTCVIIGLAAEDIIDETDDDVDPAATVNLRPVRMRLAKGTTPAVNDAADTLAMTLAIEGDDGDVS